MTSSNRRQAEDRNQVSLKDNDEDEESKYGAVDTKDQSAIGGLDGINCSKPTAPKGKWKGYHKSIEKDAFEKMTSTFLKGLSDKKNNSALVLQASQPIVPS